MTGDEHYLEAERLLSDAYYEQSRGSATLAADMRERAQIHATLALAAATAWGAGFTGYGTES